MTNRDDSNFFSNEGYNEDDFNEDEETDEEVVSNEQNFLNKNEALYALELEHLDNRLFKETNRAIMELSVKIAQEGWFWKFFTTKKRIKTVLSIYYDLFEHVNFDKEDLD